MLSLTAPFFFAEYTFTCANGETIPNYWLCDGWNDCQSDDFEDEQCECESMIFFFILIYWF